MRQFGRNSRSVSYVAAPNPMATGARRKRRRKKRTTTKRRSERRSVGRGTRGQRIEERGWRMEGRGSPRAMAAYIYPCATEVHVKFTYVWCKIPLVVCLLLFCTLLTKLMLKHPCTLVLSSAQQGRTDTSAGAPSVSSHQARGNMTNEYGAGSTRST